MCRIRERAAAPVDALASHRLNVFLSDYVLQSEVLRAAMQMAIPSFARFSVEQDRTRQLIQQAKAGDSASFERLVMLYDRRVLRLIQRLLLNREAAKDASQEVFLRLYKRLHSVNEDRDFSSWLYRLTVNICFDFLRRSTEDTSLDLIPEPTDVRKNPEQSLIEIEQNQLIPAALKELSPRERSAIVLRDLEGCSTAEVAQILGSTETTVRSQVSTGRVKIKTFVEARVRSRT